MSRVLSNRKLRLTNNMKCNLRTTPADYPRRMSQLRQSRRSKLTIKVKW